MYVKVWDIRMFGIQQIIENGWWVHPGTNKQLLCMDLEDSSAVKLYSISKQPNNHTILSHRTPTPQTQVIGNKEPEDQSTRKIPR